LIQGLRRRDKQALEYLYDHYADALYGVILRIIGSEEIAQEVFQDVILRVWNKIELYDPHKGRMFTWMHNIARNMAIDKLRSKEINKDSKTEMISDNVYNIDASQQFAPKEEHIGVKELLDQLAPEQKLVMELVYFRGFTQSEVSKEYEIPLGTVKTRLRAALIQLRKIVI